MNFNLRRADSFPLVAFTPGGRCYLCICLLRHGYSGIHHRPKGLVVERGTRPRVEREEEKKRKKEERDAPLKMLLRLPGEQGEQRERKRENGEKKDRENVAHLIRAAFNALNPMRRG